ncbi:MAG: hypothetical protein KKC66_03865 [Candidatus Omnitrophica bacterium]|nr:hypothetical protein [Candidatus Omnitrophota bacterium]MBU1933019.1 hypothetical protein [Candidatus Omnitrophota bacterium]
MAEDISIKPDLQFSIVCDSVRREDNGKMMLIGIFEVIGARVFPARHPELFIVNRWIKGSGHFKEKTRVVNSKDNKVIVETKEVEFELKDINHAHTVISKFMNITFQEAGKYQVEVLLSGDVLRYYPIILAQEKTGARPA